jgi:CDP-diacylglycerol--serine O-phosphatidyltransferase
MLAIMTCMNKRSAYVAGLLILTACFMDRFDGQVARKLNVTSDLGKELDSLSDLISFGAAPALLTWKLNLLHLGAFSPIAYIIILLFPIAGAYRLARFNVMPFSNIYSGIPITIAGGLLTVYNLFTIKYTINPIITCLVVLLLAYLMISNLKIRKR